MPVFPHNGVWPKIADDVFIAPGAMIIGDVTLAEGVSVWYNAVLRADTAPIVVGRRTNIQDNCTLHVDLDAPLTIGEECTIGHNAVVHGAHLGDRILVGMNAVILSHASIGSILSLVPAPWSLSTRRSPKASLPSESRLASSKPWAKTNIVALLLVLPITPILPRNTAQKTTKPHHKYIKSI